MFNSERHLDKKLRVEVLKFEVLQHFLTCIPWVKEHFCQIGHFKYPAHSLRINILNRECFKLSVKPIFNKIGLKLRKLRAFDYFECQPTLKWTIYRTDRGIKRWRINYILVIDEWNIWDEIITLSYSWMIIGCSWKKYLRPSRTSEGSILFCLRARLIIRKLRKRQNSSNSERYKSAWDQKQIVMPR